MRVLAQWPCSLWSRAITVRLARRFVKSIDLMARPNGFEPLTPRFVGWPRPLNRHKIFANGAFCTLTLQRVIPSVANRVPSSVSVDQVLCDARHPGGRGLPHITTTNESTGGAREQAPKATPS